MSTCPARNDPLDAGSVPVAPARAMLELSTRNRASVVRFFASNPFKTYLYISALLPISSHRLHHYLMLPFVNKGEGTAIKVMLSLDKLG